MAENIGFIGTGIMGRPMAENLIRAGFPTVVYNRTRQKAAPLEAAGARIAATPQEAADGAAVVIFMLTGPEAVDAVLEAKDGVLAAANPPEVVVNMSTVPPAYTRRLGLRLKERGIGFVDAPVLGTKKPAEDGALVILAGGEQARIERLAPVFEALGKKTVYCGAAGMGSAMKMTANSLLAVMMAGFAEALTFGERCGLSRESIMEVVLAGPLASGLFQMKGELIGKGAYEPQFPYRHMVKDLRFVLQTAEEVGAAAITASGAFALYRLGLGLDLGDLDFSAVKRTAELLADRSGPPEGGVRSS
jgi:3-hydroxyisobutyrate dehydrogenase-like beta-hydroxyacid dehydrogenase